MALLRLTLQRLPCRRTIACSAAMIRLPTKPPPAMLLTPQRLLEVCQSCCNYAMKAAQTARGVISKFFFRIVACHFGHCPCMPARGHLQRQLLQHSRKTCNHTFMESRIPLSCWSVAVKCGICPQMSECKNSNTLRGTRVVISIYVHLLSLLSGIPTSVIMCCIYMKDFDPQILIQAARSTRLRLLRFTKHQTHDQQDNVAGGCRRVRTRARGSAVLEVAPHSC